MQSLLIVILPIVFNCNPRITQAVEQFRIQALVTQPGVKTFVYTILPGLCPAERQLLCGADRFLKISLDHLLHRIDFKITFGNKVFEAGVREGRGGSPWTVMTVRDSHLFY